MNVNFSVDFNPTVITVGLAAIDAAAFIGCAWAYSYWRRVHKEVNKAIEEYERREVAKDILTEGDYVAICGIASAENGQFLQSRDRNKVGFARLYTVEKHVTRRTITGVLAWYDEIVPIERVTEAVPFRVVTDNYVDEPTLTTKVAASVKDYLGPMRLLDKLTSLLGDKKRTDDEEHVVEKAKRLAAVSVRISDAKKAEFLFEPSGLTHTYSAYREADTSGLRIAFDFLSGDIVRAHSESEQMLLDGTQCVAIGTLRRSGPQSEAVAGFLSGPSVRFELLPPCNGLPMIVSAYSFLQLSETVGARRVRWLVLTLVFGSLGLALAAWWTSRTAAMRRARQRILGSLTETRRVWSSRASETTERTASSTSSSSSLPCVVCMTAARNVICFPCAHMCLCIACAQRYFEISENSATVSFSCPVCRGNIERLQRVYDA